MPGELSEWVEHLTNLLTQQKTTSQLHTDLDSLAINQGFQRMKPHLTTKQQELSDLMFYVRSTSGEFRGRADYDVLFINHENVGYISFDRTRDVERFNQLGSMYLVEPHLKENILQRSRRKSAIGAKAVAAFTYFVTVHPDGIIFNVLIPNMSRSRDLNQDTIFAGLIALPLVAWVVGTTSYLVSRGITAYVNHKKSTQFEREYFPRITYGSAAIQRAFR